MLIIATIFIHCNVIIMIERNASKNVYSLIRALKFFLLNKVAIVRTECHTTSMTRKTSKITSAVGKLRSGIKYGSISILVPDRSPAADLSVTTVIVLKIPLCIS